MAQWYLALRHAHITLAACSVALFALRGLLMLTGSSRVNAPWLKFPSYAIDTLLLTAALILMTVIHQYPYQSAWLTVKVGLLVVYIVLGSLALRPGRSRGFRAAAFVAALVTIGGVVSVALTHHPLGVFGRFVAD